MGRPVPLIVDEELIPYVERALMRALREVRTDDNLAVNDTDDGVTLSLKGGGAGAGGKVVHNPAILKVKNNTGGEVPQFGVVRLSGSHYESSDRKLRTRQLLTASNPSTGSSDLHAIAMERIPASRVGKVAVSGVIPVKVDVRDTGHTLAAPISSDVNKLKSYKENGTGEDGTVDEEPPDTAVPLVYSASAMGEDWYFVLLGGRGGGQEQGEFEFPSGQTGQQLHLDSNGDVYWDWVRLHD